MSGWPAGHAGTVAMPEERKGSFSMLHRQSLVDSPAVPAKQNTMTGLFCTIPTLSPGHSSNCFAAHGLHASDLRLRPCLHLRLRGTGGSKAVARSRYRGDRSGTAWPLDGEHTQPCQQGLLSLISYCGNSRRPCGDAPPSSAQITPHGRTAAEVQSPGSFPGRTQTYEAQTLISAVPSGSIVSCYSPDAPTRHAHPREHVLPSRALDRHM